MPFADSHVHLHFPDFDTDREEVIQRAQALGVSHFLNVATDIPSAKQCLELANKYPFIYATAGVHPHEAKDVNAGVMQEIEALLREPKMVAIGEVGLDFFRDHSPHATQIQVMKDFLALYSRVKKPLVIHCRDAYDRFIELLLEHGEESYEGVMHCYSSGKEHLLKLVDLGFYISFAGPLTYKKNDELRAACKSCPADRILFETDAPFLPPQLMRGKRNETAFMIDTIKLAAEIRGVTLDALGEQSTQNLKRLFRIA